MGPAVSVLLCESPTEELVTEVEQWLGSITNKLEGERGDWWPFWIETGRLPGFEEDPQEACAFGLAIGKTQISSALSWEPDSIDERLQAEIREECMQWRELLGFVPEYAINIFAGCNRRFDHRILAHLALQLAERYNAMIDLHGALSPPLRPGQHWDDETVEDIEQYVQDLALPGSFLNMYYITMGDKIWISHVVDATFLRAWLKHPHFHLIK